MINNDAKKESKLEFLNNSLQACKVALYYSLFFSFISNLMMLAAPIYSLQVLDRVISSGSLDTLLMLTLITVLALICLGLVQSVRSFLLIKLGQWLDVKLTPVVFAHGVVSSAYRGDMMAKQALQDLLSIKNFITGASINSLIDTPWSLIFFVILFLMHPVLGIISIIGGVLLIVLGIMNEMFTKPSLNAAVEHSVRSNYHAEVAARNAEVIEAMGMMEKITEIWKGFNQNAMVLQAKASSISAIYTNITRFFRMLLQICVTGAGGYFVLQNELSVGAMIAAGILVGRALAPFESSIASWKGFVTTRKALKRLQKELNNSPERGQTIDLPEPQGNISFENVIFSPPEAKKPTLKNINFTINPGEVVAVIGPSASGKSTIAKLTTGVWRPASGNVRLDSADVYTWRREDFGQYVGYLPQDVELFGGTVTQNISRMEIEPDTQKVIEAAKIANVHDLILRLENGYDTFIGIGGSALSAGQRQRIALARAFYGQPKLVVLDEPNSSLDSEGEEALVKTLQGAKKAGITVIIVSHRNSILAAVDKIMVVKDGALAIFDERDAVLEKLGFGAKQNNK